MAYSKKVIIGSSILIILFVTIFILLFICINNANSNNTLIAQNNTDSISARSTQSKLIDVLTSVPRTDPIPTKPGCYLMKVPDKNGMYPPWLPGNKTPTNVPGTSSYLENVKTMTNPDPIWIETWQEIPSGSTQQACGSAVNKNSIWFAMYRSLWPTSNYKSVYVPNNGKAVHGVLQKPANVDPENYRQASTGWGLPNKRKP